MKETNHLCATKLGRKKWIENRNWPVRYTLEMVRKDTEDSLRNLGLTQSFCSSGTAYPQRC